MKRNWRFCDGLDSNFIQPVFENIFQDFIIDPAAMKRSLASFFNPIRTVNAGKSKDAFASIERLLNKSSLR